MSMLFCCCPGDENRRDEFISSTNEDITEKVSELKTPKSVLDESPRTDFTKNDVKANEDASTSEVEHSTKTTVWKPPEKVQQDKTPLTKEVKVEAKYRRTSAPQESEISQGAYLLYNEETSAILCQWSRAPIPSALAWMKPSVQIPNHLFNVNSGRNIFFNNTKDKEAYKYYQGWTHFIKLSRKYGGKIMFFDSNGENKVPSIKFLVLEPIMEGDKSLVGKYRVVLWDEQNLLYDMKNIKAVAVVPSSSTLIPVGEIMDGEIFVQRGNGEGSGIFLESLPSI